MSARVVIGVDPGPIPGVVVLRLGPPLETSVFQCDADSVLWLIRSLFAHAPYVGHHVLAVERFVVGPRASRLSTASAGRKTRDMVGAIVELGENQRDLVGRPLVRVVARSASEVMPWASDARLSRLGLYTATKGMQHARAAARHALYAAVKDAGLPDPLSAHSRKAVTE